MLGVEDERPGGKKSSLPWKEGSVVDQARVAATVDRLALWLRQRVEAAGARGLVVGLSGGIDSAVAVALCKRAMSEQVMGVAMPIHSSAADVVDARKTAEALGVPFRTIELGATFDLLLQTLTQQVEEGASTLAVANLKPRLRMLSLYFLANQYNYLVVGTDNRSEWEVGYFTKYGDGGVDLQPLARLLKGEVRQLAEYLGVPRSVIEREPSAGLWEGQTDEQEMGFGYDILDKFLQTGEGPVDVVERIKALQKGSQHKRQLPLLPPEE